MKTFFLCIFISFAFTAFNQTKSIEFVEGTYAEVLAKAKKENKLIFMDAYTTWCGPCKWMSKNIFTNDKVADYFNLNFINAKFDMEKGEGIDLAKKFEVRCYPNLLFIDGDGNLVHRSAGASRDIEDYIKLGETAMNPNENFAYYANLFASGKKQSQNFWTKYIDLISQTCLPYDEVVSQYFNQLSTGQYLSRDSWNILFNHVNDVENKAFLYLLKNRLEFEKKYTLDSVELKISSVFQNSGNKILYDKNSTEEKYKEYLQTVKNMKFNGKEAVLFNLELNLLTKKELYNEAFDLVLANEKHVKSEQLNSICWDIYEKSTQKKHLEFALKNMKTLTATEQGRNWMYMDTYASLLFKAENKKVAKQIAEEAIEIAKKAGIPSEEYKVTEDLLAKINKLK